MNRPHIVTPAMLQHLRMEVLTEALKPVGWRPEPDTKRKRANHFLIGEPVDGAHHTICGVAYDTPAVREDVKQLPRTLQCLDCRTNLLAFGLPPVFFTALE